MNEEDIQDALNALLDAASLGYTIVWPNKGASSDLPRLEVSFNPNDRDGAELDGSGDVQRAPGIMQVAVVTKSGIGPGVANGIADAVMAVFPQDTAAAITGGKVHVIQHPSARGGFPDGLSAGKYSEWRTPVIVRYIAVKG